jgi:hypothetical protein
VSSDVVYRGAALSAAASPSALTEGRAKAHPACTVVTSNIIVNRTARLFRIIFPVFFMLIHPFGLSNSLVTEKLIYFNIKIFGIQHIFWDFPGFLQVFSEVSLSVPLDPENFPKTRWSVPMRPFAWLQFR